MALETPQDRVAGVALTVAAVLVAALPAMIVVDTLLQGAPQLSWRFLVDAPVSAGRAGGIGTLVISTLWILAICLAVVLPVGLGCALYLSEFLAADSRFARWMRRCLDVLGGVPSIVFGLFGYRFFAIELGLGFSILSGGLSLACMVLPLFVSTAEQALRGVPGRYRQAAAALAVSQTGVIIRILLPVAASGIAVGLILASGRALAETAVLLFTSGYVTRMPDSMFDSGRALSVHIYDLTMNVAGGNGNAAATAVVLLTMIVTINALARGIARRVQVRYRS